jgi:death on curing protein
VSEPLWLSETVVRAIHLDQVRQHGGAHGVREEGLLQSALDRPRNRYHYDSAADLVDLAAAYGFGIARNHPFIDGNKRVAFQSMYVFLRINGRVVTAAEAEVVKVMLALAAGETTESELASWLRENSSPA